MDVSYLFNRNPLLVMSYISKIKGQTTEVTVSKISKQLGLSIGSVYNILKEFNDAGIVHGIRIGRATIYETVQNNPLIKQFRVFDNLLFLNNLVQQLKGATRKIILFGNCAQGNDTTKSDIDIFLLTEMDMQPKVRQIVANYSSEREIKPVIVDSAGLLEMREKNWVSYVEIQKGITMWGD